MRRRRKKREALVRCAGAISVNHRVITAPIIRYRDRSAEGEEAGVSRSGPGNLLAATIRRRSPVYIRAPSFPANGPRLRRLLREIGNHQEKVSITRSMEYVAINRPVN